ncbi:MAG: hypothetical protein OXB88_06775 [Bacteriovoracales bacterium]|nr:hypothetical protein [Bacteriovoracales bacterium]
MKFLILSLFLSGTLSAAYIDCRSESGNTRVRLDIDDHRGDLKDIRFTRKIAGERWEMVGKKMYDYGGQIDDDGPNLGFSVNERLYLCERNGRSSFRYPLCIQEFDLAKGFISVIFRDIDGSSDRNGNKLDVVFNLTSVEQSRNGRFRAVLFRSLYPGHGRDYGGGRKLEIDRRAVTLNCRDRN